MPVRSRHTQPPYEVMRGAKVAYPAGNGATAASPAPGTAAPKPVPPTAPVSVAQASAALTPPVSSGPASARWASRSQAPLVVRVPRGYAVVLAALIVVVVGLAFWVGQARGYRKGLADGKKEVEPLGPGVANATPTPLLPAPPAPGAGGARTSGGTQNPPPAPGNVGGAGSAAEAAPPRVVNGQLEPRQLGLNYYVLESVAVDPQRPDPKQVEYVKKLLTFLWANGVDAGAFRRHNDRFFAVVALRGFAKGDSKATEYRQALIALGRHWATQYRGGNFNDAYLELYNGQPIDQSITKENIQ